MNTKIVFKDNKKKNFYKNIKNLKTRKTKKTRKVKGGLLGAINSGSENPKTNQKNTSYIKKITKNSFFSFSSKIYNIEYIIPNNFLFLKDPSSFLTPYFNVNLFDEATKKTESKNCSIQIEEPNNNTRVKFVEYIININGEWYIMMRIYGINTGVLATLTNIVFYKLFNNKWINLIDNSIALKTTSEVTITPRSSLNILQKVANIEGENSLILKLSPSLLNKNYKAITSSDGDIYYVLRQFRNEQLINAGVKQEIIEETAEGFFDFLFNK